MASKAPETTITTSEYDELIALKAKLAERRKRSQARREAKSVAMKTPEAVKAYKQSFRAAGYSID